MQRSSGPQAPFALPPLASEWNTVFIPHWVDGFLPLKPRDNDGMQAGLSAEAAREMAAQAVKEPQMHLEEERRLAHVVRGLTHAPARCLKCWDAYLCLL